jgi:prepilin-type N-terminal cleavage/methylation domain-containing protein
MNKIARSTASAKKDLLSNMNPQGRDASMRRPPPSTPGHGFTLVELLAVVAVLALLAAVLAPAASGAAQNSKAWRCLNNFRQLTRAWTMYSADHQDSVLACSPNPLPGQAVWLQGYVDFTNRRSNWDTNQDLAKSPLWAYIGGEANLFRCAADQTSVLVDGVRMPRVRSVSMNSAFGSGEWLDRTHSSPQRVWRTYTNRTEVMAPANTFVFIEEHPASINDACFFSACTGNQPEDPPSAAQIIDYPGSFHNGRGCAISFVDGRSELHNWIGSKIRPPVSSILMPLNVPADDSWLDTHWIARNTTVRR